MYLATARANDEATTRTVAGNVLALGAVSLVTDVSAEMVTAILPLYVVVGLGLSPMAFGLLDGVYNGVTALVRLAGGHAADRWQRRKLVAGLGYGLSAVAKPAFLVAGGAVTALGAVITVDRLGKGIRTAPRDALISLSTDAAAQGRAFGVHRFMDTVGAMLGPLAAMGLMLGTGGSFSSVFVVSGAVAALGVVLLVLFVRDHRDPIVRAAVSVRESVRLLRVPAVARACVGVALLGAVTIGDGFVYLVLQERLDFAAQWFPLLPLGVAGSYLLLAIPAGRLADRIGRWRMFLAGHAALICGYATLAVGPATVPALVVVLALLGACYAATDGVLMAMVGPLIPARVRTTGMAVVQTVQALARLVGAVGFGAVWTRWGLEVALPVAALGLTIAVAVAATLGPRRATAR